MMFNIRCQEVAKKYLGEEYIVNSCSEIHNIANFT